MIETTVLEAIGTHMHNGNGNGADGRPGFTSAAPPVSDRWTAVEQSHHSGLDHLVADSPYADGIQYAADLTVAAGLPNIDISPLRGKFLQLQCKIAQATYVLEVGTIGGVSSIWLASSSPYAKVMSVYTDARRKEIAEQALSKAGLLDRIELLLGNGEDVLPVIKMYVEHGHREKFGLVFIDGDKENNERYLKDVIPMCRDNAVIILDNVLRDGIQTDGKLARNDEQAENARRLLAAAGKDADCTIVDGFWMFVVKPALVRRCSSPHHQH